jgi:hypothetical protein
MTIGDHSHETLLSKAGWREFELRLEVRFSRLEQKIADFQIGLIKWFAGIAVAQAVVIVALVKLPPGPS